MSNWADEAALLRRRDQDDRDELDRLGTTAEPGAEPLVVQTISQGAYPTAPQSYYACQRVAPGGTEAEGAAVSLALEPGVFYVANVGKGTPPPGSKLLTVQYGGRTCVQFDG